jgi:hypothetical protein
LRALSKYKYVSPYDLAMVRVGLLETDEAFTQFHEALAQRSLWLGYLNVEPQMDPLRSDERFQYLLRHVGLIPPNSGAGY